FSYPERWGSALPSLDLARAGRLDFETPDSRAFPCLRLAYQALDDERSLPIVLNAANEGAVARFFEGRIPVPAIPEIIQSAMEAHRSAEVPNVSAVRAVDQWARAHSYEAASRVELKG